jgi:tetratricopeptide (TPR) repeat protein
MLALLLAFVCEPPAWAVDEPEVLRLRAETLAAAGRCEEALRVVERARRVASDDGRLAHIAGQCELRLRRYPQAVESLEEAKRLAPELADLDLHLAMARFHLGDLAGSERALGDARARTPERAEIDLYEGLIRLERAQMREAAEALERARRRDPLAVEPIASYYAGVAWRSAAEEARAREALQRVKRESPDSPWAVEAERALTERAAMKGLPDRRDLGGEHQAERPLGSMAPDQPRASWMLLSAGFEYDDSVVLKGSGVVLPEEISHDGDGRVVWTAEIGTELLRSEDWFLGFLAGYYGSVHDDLEDFNVQYPSATVWLDRRITESSTARLQYDFGYGWVGGSDPYLANHVLTPALFHAWPRWGTTRFFAELHKSNFLFSSDDAPDGTPGASPGDPCPVPLASCGPFGANESRARNRDGYGTIAGFDHALPLDDGKTELRGGYRFHYYGARGREYSYRGHEVNLGVQRQLIDGLMLDLGASYTYRPYRHPSSFPDPDELVFGEQYRLSSIRRREETLQFDAIVEWEFSDRLVGSLRYSYLDNDSNTAVYDYDREIVGAFLTLRFYR